MALNFDAPFAQISKTATAVATLAATVTTDSPTNTIELLTAGTDGALVTSLSAMPRGTVTAASLVLFISKDSGTTKHLIDSKLMAAHTVAATTAIPATAFDLIGATTPLRLAAGDKLYVGSQVALAAGIVFSAQWMDY